MGCSSFSSLFPLRNGIRLVDKSTMIAGEKGKGKEMEDEGAELSYKNNVRAGYLYSQSIRLSDGLALIGTILNALVSPRHLIG